MNNSIFRKAKKAVKHLIFESSTEFDEFYNFHFPDADKEDDVQVSIHNGIRGTYYKCTCKFHSIHTDKPYLCTYTLAVMMNKLK